MPGKNLVGSGDKIMAFTLPFVIVGLVLNKLFPSIFRVGDLPPLLKTLSALILIIGVVFWLWSVFLIITKAAKNKLITAGPYALVKHPIYTSVSLLVLPGLGLLMDSWLGILIGSALYIGSRKYAPEEEIILSKTFGEAWDNYNKRVKIPWI